MGGALQGDAQEWIALAIVLRGEVGNDQFVADGQMVLQGLAKIGNFARAFIEDNRLVEEVALQVFADEVDLRTQ
ncbi:hypothetical protein D3C80_2107120 [compost metagenome]